MNVKIISVPPDCHKIDDVTDIIVLETGRQVSTTAALFGKLVGQIVEIPDGIEDDLEKLAKAGMIVKEV